MSRCIQRSSRVKCFTDFGPSKYARNVINLRRFEMYLEKGSMAFRNYQVGLRLIILNE